MALEALGTYTLSTKFMEGEGGGIIFVLEDNHR